MPDANIDVLLEAVLFFKGGSLTVPELSAFLQTTPEAIENALETLRVSLENRGIRLVREGNSVALATAPEANRLVQNMRTDELEGSLGKAGLETLAIIIYRGPLAKSDIDYVRGVNCGYILRSLMIRGLVERAENPNDKRSFLYRATAELPAYLGVTSLETLPGYAGTKAGIERVFADREKLVAVRTATEESGEFQPEPRL